MMLNPKRSSLVAEVWLAQQAAYDLWQARQAVKASKVLSAVKALKLHPA